MIGQAITAALQEQRDADLDRIDPPLYWCATNANPFTLTCPVPWWARREGRLSEWDWRHNTWKRHVPFLLPVPPTEAGVLDGVGDPVGEQ